ncbi:MAG: hypothetical protein EOO68_39145 [Moraxellaceae bacterium]|nr:MAG: hypothetical protein EOO68_39145 [Moraxellaceae bacterium]
MNKPAFEVTLNGQKIATAQIESDFGVLTTIVTWVRRDDNSESLNVSISGLDSVAEKKIKWAAQDLKIGDKLLVSVIEEKTTQKDEKGIEILRHDFPKALLRIKVLHVAVALFQLRRHRLKVLPQRAIPFQAAGSIRRALPPVMILRMRRLTQRGMYIWAALVNTHMRRAH